MAQSPTTRLRRAMEALDTALDPMGRVKATQRVREAAEDLERDAVKAARKAGHSWASIGHVFGVSKQGAQQRFRGTGESKPAKEPKKPFS